MIVRSPCVDSLLFCFVSRLCCLLDVVLSGCKVDSLLFYRVTSLDVDSLLFYGVTSPDVDCLLFYLATIPDVDSLDLSCY